MAKKGAAAQLQVEIDSKEQWDILVERSGLIRKQLNKAKCDHIPCLERFRNKSRPTWMFISNKRMIRLMFGADSPKLTRILMEEITKVKKAMADGVDQKGIDFDELTEEEQALVDEEVRIREEAEQREKEARERAINERREAVVENLIQPLNDYSFVVFWPHVTNDNITMIMNAVKETVMQPVGKPIKHQITDEDVFEMFFYSTWKYADLELEELMKAEATALLFQGQTGNEEIGPLDVLFEKLYGTSKTPPGDEDSLAVKISTTIQITKEDSPEETIPVAGGGAAGAGGGAGGGGGAGWEGGGGGKGGVGWEGGEEEGGEEGEERREKRKSSADEGKERRKSSAAKPPEPARKSTLVPTRSMIRRRSTRKSGSGEEEFIEMYIPGLYIPENNKCKVAAMRIFFPNVTKTHDLPEPEPIPPHCIIAFDAFKRRDVLQLASEWPDQTMQIGFFTSADAESAELIAKTLNQYQNLSVHPLDAKLVVQVSKVKSEPLLSYSVLGPTYVSANCVIGEKEAAIFFPEGYYEEEEPEPEPEPVKKKSKKRARGSKTSVTSDTSKTSEELGEEGLSEEGLGEEGLDEVAEDEEEEHEGDEDDYDPLAGYQEPVVEEPVVEEPVVEEPVVEEPVVEEPVAEVGTSTADIPPE